MAKKFSIKIKHPGALRRSTHTKKGHKIPVATLHRLAKKAGITGKRARLALAFRKMRHK